LGRDRSCRQRDLVNNIELVRGELRWKLEKARSVGKVVIEARDRELEVRD